MNCDVFLMSPATFNLDSETFKEFTNGNGVWPRGGTPVWPMPF